MVASLTFSNIYSKLHIEKVVDTGKALCKIGAYSVPLFAAMALTYTQHFGLGVACAFFMRSYTVHRIHEAFLGEKSPEKIQWMLSTALKITALVWFGLLLGWSPYLIKQTFLTLSPLWATLFTLLWANGGQRAWQCWKSSQMFTTQKISDYLTALKTEGSARTYTIQEARDLFSFLITIKDHFKVFKKSLPTTQKFVVYMTDKKVWPRLSQAILSHINDIAPLYQTQTLLDDPPNQQLIVTQIKSHLEVLSAFLMSFPPDAQQALMKNILQSMPMLSMIPALLPSAEEFLAKNKSIVDLISKEYRLTMPVEQLQQIEIEVAQVQESTDPATALKQLNALRDQLRVLLQANSYSAAGLPNDEELKQFKKKVSELFQKTGALISRFGQKQPARSSEDAIDVDDTVLNMLMAKIQVKKNIDNLLKQLRETLNVDNDSEIEPAIERLGLEKVQSLFDLGIATKEECLQNDLVTRNNLQMKIITWIGKNFKPEAKLLDEAPAAHTEPVPDPSLSLIERVQEIGYEALYRMTQACAMLAPLLADPKTALLGFSLGLLGLGAYALYTGRVPSVHELKDRGRASILFSPFARGSFISLNEQEVTQLEKFKKLSIFLKLDTMAGKFISSTVFTYATKLGGMKLGWPILWFPFMEGAFLSREILEKAVSLIQNSEVRIQNSEG